MQKVRDDTDRLYFSRKEQGRVLASIQDNMDTLIPQLKDCKNRCRGRLMKNHEKQCTQNNNQQNRNDNKTKTDGKQLIGLFKWKKQTKYHETTRHSESLKKYKTLRIVDFTVLAEHTEKLKGGEKKDKCLEVVREPKKLWNMKVTVI